MKQKLYLLLAVIFPVFSIILVLLSNLLYKATNIIFFYKLGEPAIFYWSGLIYFFLSLAGIYFALFSYLKIYNNQSLKKRIIVLIISIFLIAFDLLILGISAPWTRMS